MEDLILDIRGVSKSFGGVQALRGVSFSLRRGEVHSLVGENGAGKSTLMKIISGAIREYDGELHFDGQPVHFADPLEAQQSGIATIYQERSLMPDLDGAQNIMVGIEPKTRLGAIDKAELRRLARVHVDTVSQGIDLSLPVRRMSAAKQQLIEIAKALARGPRVIIMDEPTSSLTESETGTLIRAIKDLKEQGTSIIFISHKMDDIFGVSDRVTVLRDGAVIETRDIEGVSEDDLIRMMVGRRIENLFDHSEVELGEELLRVEHISRKNKFHDLSFAVRAGEVVGLSGLVGAGRSEMALSVFGYDRLDEGAVYVRGEKVDIRSPQDAIALGLGLIPEDRKLQGLVQIMSIRDNMTLAALGSMVRGGMIQRGKQSAVVDEYIQALQIKTPSARQQVSNLSGGNQQKVVLGKWLATNPSILILDEPTRGIDVGTKAEIYRLIGELSRQGMAIVLISSEMPEILGLSRRILVMREGELVASMDRAEATEEAILAHYLGGN